MIGHRRTALVLAAVALGCLLAAPRAEAGLTRTVSLVPGDDVDAIALTGNTFDEVAGLLSADDTPSIAVPISGMGTIPDLPMVLDTPDATNHVITLVTDGVHQYLPAGSPFAGVDVELLLLADWTDATDLQPDVVLGVRLGQQLLSDIQPAWGAVPGLDGELGFDDVVLALSSGPMTLDPTELPAVGTFFGIDGPLTEDLVLDQVSELLAAVDLESMPALEPVARFLGADPTEVLSMAGPVADTAALLFDGGATLDPADLALDADISSTQLPTWLQDRLPSFDVSLGTEPSISVHDEFTVVTPDGTENDFGYDLALSEVAGLDVTVEAASFNPPFGLGWMGDLSPASLHLHSDGTALEAAFQAGVTIGGEQVSVEIAVSAAPDAVTGLVDVEGDVDLDALVEWLAGSSAFSTAELDASALANVTLHALELSYRDDAGDRTLSAFAATTLPTPTFLTTPTEVQAEALLALRHPSGGATTLLAGLKVTDDTCTAAPPCIGLGTLLPFPDGELAAELTIPAVNLLTVQPSGAVFDPDGLGTRATALLTELRGTADADPFDIQGSLEVRAAVPLDGFAPTLTELGITLEPDPEVVLTGSLDFDLAALADGSSDEPAASFDLRASLPTATTALPPALAGWFDSLADVVPGADVSLATGPWSMFLRGTTEGDVELGVSLPGIEVDLGAGPPISLDAEAMFSGTPDGDFSLTLSLGLGAEIDQPFGIDFLTLDDAAVTVTITSIAGTVDAEVAFTATVSIGTHEAELSLTIELAPEPALELTVSLLDTIEVQEVLPVFGAAEFVDLLPPQVQSAGVGPATFTLRVDGDGVAVDVVVDIVAPLFAPGQNLTLSTLFSMEFPDTGSPRFTAGLRPSTPLTLGGLLGADLDPDFTLIGDDSSLGIVVSSAPLDPTSPDRTDTLRDWFDPLLVDGLEIPDLVAGVTGLGRLPLPSAVSDLMENLAVQPEVQLIGSIPVPGTEVGEFSARLYLVADPDALPWMIDSANLFIGVSVDVATPKVTLTAGGSMVLLVKQGLDATIADGLSDIGIVTGLPVAEEVEPDDDPAEVCPLAGGVIRPEDVLVGTDPTWTTEQHHYCMDRLQISVDGELSLTASGVELVVGGGITHLGSVPGSAWHPLGLDWVGLRQLRADLSVEYTFATQAVTFEVGVLANVDLFGKNFSGALQMGVSVQPAPTPIGFIATPSFGGVRGTVNELATGDLIDLQQAASELLGTPALPDSIEDAIPNIALRNLEFSLSPLGVPRLCIPMGIVIRGDLYINPAPGTASDGEPPCDPSDPPGAPPDSALCPANKANGCVAGVLLRITPEGIRANGFLAGFDLNPALPIRWDDLELDLNLTLGSPPYFKLSGGAAMGPAADPWASGELAISLGLTDMTFFGRLQVLGFNALVDAHLQTVGGDDPLELLTNPSAFNPNLSLHVVLADDTFDLGGDPDFADEIAALAEPHLDHLQVIVSFVDEVLDDLSGGDPLGVVLGLPARLQEHGIPVPAWIQTLASKTAELDLELGGRTTEALLDTVLNGIHLPATPGTWVPATRTCFGIDLDVFGDDGRFEPIDVIGKVTDGPDGDAGTADDQCWSVEFVIPGVFVDPDVTTADFSDLTRIELPAACIGLLIDGDCILFPAVDFDGVCATIFPALTGPSTPGGARCTLAEVKDEVERLITTGLSTIGLDLAGLDLVAILEQIRAFVAGDGELFAIECAETELQLSLQGENSASVALDAELFGAPLGVAFTFDFEHPGDSLSGLLRELWGLATGTGDTDDACGGVDLEVFGSAAATGGTPLPGATPAPLVLSVATSPGRIDEGGETTATVSFNRPLEAGDGSKTVTVDWGDGTTTEAEVGVGEDGFTRSHIYADDDPTATASDLYTVRVSAPSMAADTDTVRVYNVAPELDIALDRSRVDEGSSVHLTVDVTDVGAEDSHDLRIDWGDGTIETVADATARTELDHTYADDDPTGTDSDQVTVRVRATDDDGGRDSAAETLDVDNVAPSAAAVALSPTTVQEGALVSYTIAFTDPGTGDSHTVLVDWDDDGTYDTTSPVTAGARSVVVAHRFPDDDPTGTPSDTETIGVRVVDDDTGTVSFERTLTVDNVAPVVCTTLDPDGFPPVTATTRGCPAAAERSVDEGDTVTVTGVFSDPGTPDTHRIVIDWGHDSISDTVIEPDAGTRTFAASHTYGDDGSFTIGISVTDDDTGVGLASERVIVANVDPSTAIDETGTLLADGPDDDAELDTPTFITRAGSALTLSAATTDPGSDDLTHVWTWDLLGRFGDGTTSEVSLVNPPAADGKPSPSVQPRSVVSSPSHTWSQPCLYEVGVAVGDDDDGTATDRTWVVVTGTESRIRAPGYWYNQYDTSKKKNSQTLGDTTLACHLDSVAHLSRVFGTYRQVDTFRQAQDVLNTRKTSNDREIMVRQLLATWLNVVDGSLSLDQLVDTDLNGTNDTPFRAALLAGEAARVDPTTSRSRLLVWENVFERINGA